MPNEHISKRFDAELEAVRRRDGLDFVYLLDPAGKVRHAAAAQSDSYFDLVQAFFNHWFGRIVLFGFSWALIHHALGGIRHFIWDMGQGFKLSTVEWMVRANLIGSIVLTILLWAVAYGVKP